MYQYQKAAVTIKQQLQYSSSCSIAAVAQCIVSIKGAFKPVLILSDHPMARLFRYWPPHWHSPSSPRCSCNPPNLPVNIKRAVVVAQLVERSLPIPEVRGSNPVIGKNLFIYWTFVFCQLCIENTKIKKKRPGMAHLKNIYKGCMQAENEGSITVRLTHCLTGLDLTKQVNLMLIQHMLSHRIQTNKIG